MLLLLLLMQCNAMTNTVIQCNTNVITMILLLLMQYYCVCVFYYSAVLIFNIEIQCNIILYY